VHEHDLSVTIQTHGKFGKGNLTENFVIICGPVSRPYKVGTFGTCYTFCDIDSVHK